MTLDTMTHLLEFCHEQESERRISCEALYYWTDLLAGRVMPRPEDIDIARAPEDLARYLFVLSTGNGGGRFMVQKSGGMLDGAGGDSMAGRSLMEAFPAPLNDRALECCLNAIRARQPMVDSGILVLENETELVYRLIMMPLSVDGRAVDHVLGAFSYRRVE